MSQAPDAKYEVFISERQRSILTLALTLLLKSGSVLVAHGTRTGDDAAELCGMLSDNLEAAVYDMPGHPDNTMNNLTA